MAKLGLRVPELRGTGQFIAGSAEIIGSVRLKANSSVWFNAVLRGDNDWIEIGENSNIQDASVLHTDPGVPIAVGQGVTVGHKVMLHGCFVGDNSMIGIGSTVLNRARIGSNCLVGAHSLVTEGREFPDGVLILGSPAKIVRHLEPAEIEMLKASAAIYVENAKRFLNEFELID
jgi:carbonic anhydrase/acetyltransferase-like protein (isoleucine patch superfamily)